MGLKAGKWGEKFPKYTKEFEKSFGKEKPPSDFGKAMAKGSVLAKLLAECDKFIIIFSMARGANKEGFLEPYTKKARETIAEHKTFVSALDKAMKNKSNLAFSKAKDKDYVTYKKKVQVLLDQVEQLIRQMAVEIGIEVKKAEKAAKNVVEAVSDIGKGRLEFSTWAKKKKLRSPVNVDSKKDKELLEIKQIEEWNEELPKNIKTFSESLGSVAAWWNDQKEHKKSKVAADHKAVSNFLSDHAIKRVSEKFNLQDEQEEPEKPEGNDEKEQKAYEKALKVYEAKKKASQAEVGKKRATLKKELKELEVKVANLDVLITNSMKSTSLLAKAISADIKRRKELKAK